MIDRSHQELSIQTSTPHNIHISHSQIQNSSLPASKPYLLSYPYPSFMHSLHKSGITYLHATFAALSFFASSSQ